jgi:hypothetical protein
MEHSEPQKSSWEVGASVAGLDEGCDYSVIGGLDFDALTRTAAPFQQLFTLHYQAASRKTLRCGVKREGRSSASYKQ